MPHPQHIHGLLGADAPNTMLATPADDTDHDGYIELAEGQKSYGPILLSLTSPPGGALSDFPTAPGGVIDFKQTYDLADSSIFPAGFTASDLFPLTDREIVIHGLTVPQGAGAGTPGEVDGSGGYKAVLPVADGFIRAAALPCPNPRRWSSCWWARSAASPPCDAGCTAEARGCRRSRWRRTHPSAATPGSVLPSSHSRNAPPAVDDVAQPVDHPGMAQGRDGVAAAGDAAQLARLASPPRPLAPAPTVAASKGGVSNAPSGPFHTSVFSDGSRVATVARPWPGPTSRIIVSAGHGVDRRRSRSAGSA